MVISSLIAKKSRQHHDSELQSQEKDEVKENLNRKAVPKLGEIKR